MAGGAGSSIGKGGMITKILAAKRAAARARPPSSPGAASPDVLLRLVQGEAIGTLLVANAEAAGPQAMDGRPSAAAGR
jgi:glutamate 5-kinase